MKKILYILCMLFASSAFASPITPKDFQWHMTKDLGNKITLKSVVVLNNNQINLIRNTFDDTEKRFFLYYNVSRNSCSYDTLQIRVLNSYDDLNSRIYFPNLDDEQYAKQGELIYGRYYRNTNDLYIITPDISWPGWKYWFAHELIHYFFDDCGKTANGKILSNNKEEHETIEKFLDTYNTVFPGM